MKLCKDYLRVNIFKYIKGFLEIYFQGKDMADFDVLQGKLKPPTLKLLMTELDLYEKYSF